MEKLNKTNRNFLNRCIMSILSFMGLCSAPCLIECAYGTSSADYAFKGTITDEEGLPLSNVSVALFQMEREEILQNGVEALKQRILSQSDDGEYKSISNEKGKYSLSCETDGPNVFTLFYLKEGYEMKDTTLYWNQLTIKGKSGTYDGKGTATIDIVLKKEQNAGDGQN